MNYVMRFTAKSFDWRSMPEGFKVGIPSGSEKRREASRKFELELLSSSRFVLARFQSTKLVFFPALLFTIDTIKSVFVFLLSLLLDWFLCIAAVLNFNLFRAINISIAITVCSATISTPSVHGVSGPCELFMESWCVE